MECRPGRSEWQDWSGEEIKVEQKKRNTYLKITLSESDIKFQTISVIFHHFQILKFKFQ